MIMKLERCSALKLALLAMLMAFAFGCTQKIVIPAGPGTPEFLDKTDFAGSYRPSKRRASWGGESEYSGQLIFTNLTRDAVENVLPSDLELAVNTSAAFAHLHPVILMLGTQANTAWLFPWGSPAVGQNYQELILLVPFVQKTGKSRWHNYVVKMYLNDFVATVLGNQFYGYQKQMAAFDAIGNDFNVYLQGIQMFESEAAPVDPWTPYATALPTFNNLSDALEIVSMPILGTLVLVPTKPYTCSYFEWDMTAAEIRKMSSSHDYNKPFVAPQMDPWVALGTLTSVSDGAFEVRKVQWRLAFPAKACSF